MLLSYEDAVKMASEHLATVNNLKTFCIQNGIKGYQNVINIKNNKTKKRFPFLISKILTIFGNDVTIQTFFELKDKENGNKPEK